MKRILASLIMLLPIFGHSVEFDKFSFRLVEYSIGTDIGIYDIYVSGEEGNIRKASSRRNETKIILEKNLTKHAVKELRSMLEPELFVRLQESYVNPGVFDGSEYAFILILPCGRHEVFVSNVYNKYFNQIFDAVNNVFLEDGLPNRISKVDESTIEVELKLRGEPVAGGDATR